MFRLLRPRIRAGLARCLLGLWLFTLTQGVAQACVLQIAEGEHAEAGVAKLAHQHEHEHDDGSSSEALCVKTCDELQDSLLLKNPSWAADPGPALPTAFSSWQAPSRAVGFVSRSHPASGGSPPISIRFLRLTL